MPSVGTAYVNIRVSTVGFEKSLQSMLKRLSKQMETGGKQLGDDFVKGLSSSNTEKFFRDLELRGQKASTKMSNDLKKVERSLDDVGLTASDAGDMLESSFARSSATLKNTNDDLRRVSSSAKDVDRSGRRAGSSLRNIGGGSGFRSAANDAGFFSNALNSMSREGVQARKWLQGLHDALAFTGTAAGVAVGGLSSAAQGIFALGAQAAATGPALGVLASGLVGLGQVGGVLAISMHGVGAAISAGFKSVDKSAATAGKSATGMGKATAAAARAVRDAKQNLQQAYQDAARSAADAARRTADAEKALAKAQLDTAAAQKTLTAAWAEGLQQIQEIKFAAEDASLAEDRAALSLADAQQQMIATSELAPDDRSRVEAELAFKEADLNMREATNRRQQADKDQKKAAKSGVEGTDAMIQAHQDVADAQDAEAKAGQDLADARRDEARTAQDNARKIADAQQAVADAQKALADAQKAGTGATKAATTAADAYKTALDKLSPKQREFVKRLVALGPQFKAARDKIADPLFGGLLDGLNTVVKSALWDQVVTELAGTSGALGDLVRKGADAATKPPFSTSLVKTLHNNQGVITNFGTAAGNLAGAFIQIADAAGPTLTDFSEWVKKVTAAWNQTETLDNKTGALDTRIQNAGKRVAEFKDLFVALWGWLRKVGGAAQTASEQFKWTDKKGNPRTGYIPKLTESLKEFTKGIDKSANVKRFTTALSNLDSEGAALKSAIIDPLLIMGGDKRIGDAFDIIAKSDAFKDLAKQAGDAGPALATLVTNLAELFNTISKSGSLKTFLDVLGGIVGHLTDLVEKVPVPVLQAIGTALGTIAAVKFATNIGTKIFSSFIPPPGALKAIRGIPGTIRGAADKALGAGIFMQEAGTEVGLAFEEGILQGLKSIDVVIFRAVKNALPKTGLVAAGREFMTGIAVGFDEAKPAIKLAAEAIANSALAAIKAVWKISSPSIVATGIGVNIGEAYASGMRDSTAVVDAAAAEMGASSVASLKEGSAGAGAVGASVGAKAGGAAGGGLGALGGAAGGEIGKVGKFAGVMGKFSKVLGPATKLMKPLSLGIRGVGLAFKFAMGPVGMIILTVLPLLWPLLVKLEKRTHIFSKALDAMTTAFKWLWGKIQDLFGWLKKNWPTVLAILTGPLGIAVLLITKHWNAIRKLISGAIHAIKGFFGGMWDGITSGLRAAWTTITGVWANILGTVSGWKASLSKRIGNIWGKFTSALSNAWSSVLGVWKRIQTAVSGWRITLTKRIGNIWGKFTSSLGDAWNWVIRKWTNIKNTVLGWKTALGNSIGNIWGKFSSSLGDAWAWVVRKWRGIKTAVGGWKDDIAGSLSKIWNGMGSGLISAINWVGDKVNWLIGKLNGILDKFKAPNISVKWPNLRWAGHFAEGGPVLGPGGPKSDNLLARLSSGEHVLTAAEVKAIGGHSRVTAMRQAALRGQSPGSTDGTGGILGSIGHLASTVGNALKHGYQWAFNWALSKFKSLMGSNDNIVKKVILGGMEWGSSKIAGLGKSEDAKKKARERAAAAAGGTYHGPPGGWTYPLSHHYSITQKPNTGHNPSWAVDIGAPGGSTVRAASRGVVHSVLALGNRSYGNYIVINHAGGQSTLYAHLRSFAVKAGQAVKTGQTIGISDSTGHSTGNHLHFELRPSSSTIAAMAAHGVKLGSGGVVGPSAVGTMALLAEAGKSERVTPLDSEGFTPAERRMLAVLETQFSSGGGDTFHVHPAQGMNETALADKVSRRVAWNRRRGAGSR